MEKLWETVQNTPPQSYPGQMAGERRKFIYQAPCVTG